MSTITTTDGTEISGKNGGEGISELRSRSENGIDAPVASHGLCVIPRGRGDGFQASIRGHILDLADPSSGHALAPTPDDLFIISIASAYAWSARTFLRASGLPDDVSVSATWRTPEDPPSPADINLTVTVSSRTEAVSTVLAAAFENSLAARSLAKPVVHISVEEEW